MEKRSQTQHDSFCGTGTLHANPTKRSVMSLSDRDLSSQKLLEVSIHCYMYELSLYTPTPDPNGNEIEAGMEKEGLVC